jgi:tetratricopeptide (TPR) repeat protein
LLRTAEEQQEYLPLAYAWKSRALLQIGKTEIANKMVDSAFMTLDDSKATRTFVNAAKANYLLRIGQELEAIPYLEYALESNSKTLDKYRWQFLLAQLYKDNGQFDKALTYFNAISKSNVPFDMAFEASLQRSLLQGGKYDSADEQVRPLLRMLREGKNDGYQDQILFQAGQIYEQKDDIAKALSYFKKSLAQPNRSNYQATETYLKLGDYYFGEKQYVVAQNYYDSVATVLPADYTDVNKVRRKLGYMNEITQLYADIARKDTLLYLASLDEQGRGEKVNTYANDRLQIKLQQMEQQAKLAKKNKGKQIGGDVQSNQALAINSLDQNEKTTEIGADRTFYFNNPDELLLGRSAFKRRWGNRQPKDNWRYESDNSQLLTTNAKVVTTETEEQPKEQEVFDAEAYVVAIKDSYLREVPSTKGALDSMHQHIHDNLIVLGNIYRDYTKDNLEAIQVYEEFLKRYPNTPAAAEIYYSLYRMYSDIDQEKANHYKGRLLALFPNSLHAKVAADPAYMDKYRRDKNILDRLFERLFALYAEGDHVAVIQEADRELQGRFENTALVAQVEYLRALAIGRVGRVDDFTDALVEITQKFPSDSLVTPLALENIAFIEQNPALFVNRVNALQDVDRSRQTFIDEPDMTPWPALHINGDYRSGIALAVAEPERPAEPKEEEKPAEEAPEKIAELSLVGLQENKVEQTKEVQVGGRLAERKVDVVARIEIESEGEEKESVQIEERKAEQSELSLEGINSGANIAGRHEAEIKAAVQGRQMDIGMTKIDLGPNDYRDKKLFPDIGEYYFTINVMDGKVNMAPSRYGIGQFNRTRYQNASINHQLKVVNGENQLIFVGPFKSFEEVKAYESRIMPMMPEIMKVPSEIYNTFVIMKEIIPSLTDGVTIGKYRQNYIEQ